MSKARKIAPALVCAVAVAAGCSAGPQAQSGPSATGSRAASPAPAASSASTDQPVASDDTGHIDWATAAREPCSILRPQQINAVLGTDVGDGELKRDDARNIVQCSYSGGDPVSIIVVGLSLEDGAKSFDLNSDLAPAYFGAEAEPTSIPPAKRAYLVVEPELKAPIVGMLVADRFVQLQVGVDSAPPDKARELAGIMAARLG